MASTPMYGFNIKLTIHRSASLYIGAPMYVCIIGQFIFSKNFSLLFNFKIRCCLFELQFVYMSEFRCPNMHSDELVRLHAPVLSLPFS